MSDQIALQTILDECTARLRSKPCQDKFLNNLTGGDDPEKASPVYAFKWAESAIEEAVRQQELQRLAHAAEHHLGELSASDSTDETERLGFIIEYYRREALNKSENVNSSTSSISNLIEDYERKITVRIYRWLIGDGFGFNI
jgi:hypothetical protein